MYYLIIRIYIIHEKNLKPTEPCSQSLLTLRLHIVTHYQRIGFREPVPMTTKNMNLKS